MSTSPVSGAAKTAARLYPVVTILALVLSFVLFISGDGGSLARTVIRCGHEVALNVVD